MNINRLLDLYPEVSEQPKKPNLLHAYVGQDTEFCLRDRHGHTRLPPGFPTLLGNLQALLPDVVLDHKFD